MSPGVVLLERLQVHELFLANLSNNENCLKLFKIIDGIKGGAHRQTPFGRSRDFTYFSTQITTKVLLKASYRCLLIIDIWPLDLLEVEVRLKGRPPPRLAMQPIYFGDELLCFNANNFPWKQCVPPLNLMNIPPIIQGRKSVKPLSSTKDSGCTV